MPTYRVCLEPLAPLYVGTDSRARRSGALVHSDTLHGALMTVAGLTGSPLLEDGPRLRVTSLFPFRGGIFFYPRPFLPIPGVQENADPTGRKRWKSVRLVSEGLLRAWLENDPAPFEYVEMVGDGLACLERETANTSALTTPFHDDHVASVTVDRAGGDSTPYDRRVLRVNTAGGWGLWFGVHLETETVDGFRALVEHLGEQGLGGERSVGYGRFTLRDVTLWDGLGLRGTERFMTLSLYLPTRDEVQSGVLDAPAAYDCAVRAGWIHGRAGSAMRRRGLRMCVEGSVFRRVTPWPGDVRDTAPRGFDAHPVWRSGLAFPIAFGEPAGDTP